MNDQPFKPSPSMDLPKPQPEVAPPNGETSMPYAETAAAQAVEQTPSASPVLPQAVPPAPPANPAPAGVPSDNVAPVPSTTATTAYPHIAEDNDLIEKEWVVRAKQIVEHTKNDPYLQNQEISKMKTEYLKKRYNRDLKAGGE